MFSTSSLDVNFDLMGNNKDTGLEISDGIRQNDKYLLILRHVNLKIMTSVKLILNNSVLLTSEKYLCIWLQVKKNIDKSHL